MRDEGVIKYEYLFRKTAPPPHSLCKNLIHWRNQLFAEGLIGVYPDGIGFGNVSVRLPDSPHFLITGTQTGHKPELTVGDISLVTGYGIERNQVICEGTIAASSESLTHAAVYELSTAIHAVIHVHHRELWTKGQECLPTTEKSVAYGTPAMAQEMARLYALTPQLAQKKILIMAGHDEGVITFGTTLAEAYTTLINAMHMPPEKTA